MTRALWATLMAVGSAIAMFSATSSLACLIYAFDAGILDAHPAVVFGWLGGAAGAILPGLFGV